MAAAVLLVTAAGKSPLLSAGDYVFLVALAVLIGARLLDGRHGTEAHGSVDVSATSPKKYAVGVAVLGALLFVALRVVAPRVF